MGILIAQPGGRRQRYHGAVAVELRTRRFSVDDYHRMVEAGILASDDRVELIEGEVVEMSPIGSHHIRCVNRLNNLLAPAVQGRAIVSVQNSVRLPPSSEPQPDLALLQWREDFYTEVPGPDDVLLIIEVADSSLAEDRRRKLPLYGAAGIPETWLVDLPSQLIEVHREPAPHGYSLIRLHSPGERLAPIALPDVQVDVALILS